MASPQTEDGFLKIARELVKIFCRFRIPGQEMQIIWVVLKKTWGYQKKWDWISLKQYAELTLIDRRRCHTLLNSLINKNIVLKNGDNKKPKYCFNKNYEQWKVSPKKVTVQKKIHPDTNNGVKTDTENDTHNRKKENIQKKEPVSPKKVTSQNPYQTPDDPRSNYKVNPTCEMCGKMQAHARHPITNRWLCLPCSPRDGPEHIEDWKKWDAKRKKGE